MRFLPILQTIKLQSALKPQTILDMAYIVVLLPLLLILKAPMLLFTVVVIGILIFTKSPARKVLLFSLFVLGVVALFFSFYGSFNFQGLSRLKLFLELLVSILLFVVSLQRLTREINFYLLISPVLLLALSLFFFHGLPMLVYVVFEIFFLLWMVLTHRMEGNLIESFRTSIVMFLYSLPWVVLLFIFFPRISFEHANYGFKGETVQRMGHDGTMFLDNKALLVPSERVVMEVSFSKEVPPSHLLYFRGSILYVDKQDHWEPFPSYIQRHNQPSITKEPKPIDYIVTLYPTQKRWIYLLDMPAKAVKESTLNSDLISQRERPITEPVHYKASAFILPSFHDKLDRNTLKVASFFSPLRDPQAYSVAKELKESLKDTQERAEAIMTFFKQQSLTYSLKPAALDIKHTTDSFLFDKRQGYCVHFASAFVTMARMAGIPSRVVTGYKANRRNSVNNYIAIQERDAHAWSELYIKGQWVRYEATATASRIESTQGGITQNDNSQQERHPLFKQINLYLMYVKYQVESWILYYSNIRQLQLLQYAKEHPEFIIKFILSIVTFLIATFTLIVYFRRPRCTREVLCILAPLVKAMEKKGYSRKNDETLHHYLQEYLKANLHVKNILEIDRIYEEISYAGDTSKRSRKKLKKLVRKAVKEIAKKR